jgi:class 3 adenylate cyclase/CHASE2 domain-containing sensor protein
MTRLERKLLLINGVLGTSLTLIVLLLDQFGWLQSMERWFYDRRALYCQVFAKPPSDRIVYLDIDDNALDTIGRWPWDRNKWARILDELTAANPKLVFLDVVFSESEKPVGVPRPDGTFELIDQDPTFAAAIHRAGNILLPLTLAYSSADTHPTDRAIYDSLSADLELTPAEVSSRLAKAKIPLPATQTELDNRFIAARHAAMADRIRRELAIAPASLADLRTRLLPRTDTRQVDSPLIRLLAEEYDKFERLGPLKRFMLSPRTGLPPLLTTSDEIAPIAVLGRQAGGSGFVNCIEDPDGVLRRIPMLIQHRDQIVPQVGLVIACKLLGADLNDAQIKSDRLEIKCPDRRVIDIPLMTREQSNTGAPIGALIDIPFFGGHDWQTMYDPQRKERKLHVPMNLVWQVFQTRDAIELNSKTADRAIGDLDALFPDDVTAYATHKPSISDPEARLPILTKFLENIDGFLKQYQGANDLTADEKLQIQNLQHAKSGLTAITTTLRQLSAQLKTQRAALHAMFAGKAVLIGSTASSGAYDLKPSPLHEKCPGIVIHGVIANGILTGELWRAAPLWIRHLITLFMGLATTALVLRLTTTKAALAALSLATAYLLINGLFLFDYLNIIVGVAGPIVAMLLTWLVCQLTEIIIEKKERRRITRRFQSYVDPALVKYVIEHPEQNVMSGLEREMTVVFTDLAGFTTISETLKEKVVPLLNEYLGMMVTIIRKHHGYVNKFLGDGIMFFYNAPWDNPNHAVDAISTVMEMQDVMLTFNNSLKQRGLPALTMRAGIVTGNMIVGDAGSKDGSDYTVIGDNVNLAARLESANKATDTRVMMTARTCELLNGQFLVRPTARLQVKGKTQGVDTCELIARTAQATDEQHRKAELGRAVFEAFVKSDFAACLRAVDALEKEFGPTKLTKAYHELSEQYLKDPPGDTFDGQIVLHEK